EGQRKHAAPGNPSVSRLEAHNPAGACGMSYGAAGVRSNGYGKEPARNRRPCSRRRSAGVMVGVPWIASLRKGRVDVGTAARKLIRRELPHDDGALGAQTLHDKSVRGCQVVDQELGTTSRVEAPDVDQVLQRDRYAVKTPARLSGLDLFVRQFC